MATSTSEAIGPVKIGDHSEDVRFDFTTQTPGRSDTVSTREHQAAMDGYVLPVSRLLAQLHPRCRLVVGRCSTGCPLFAALFVF